MSQSNPLPPFTLNSRSFSDYLDGILVDAAVPIQRFGPREAVFLEGDPGGSAFFIRTGSVDIVSQGPDGKERLLHRLGKGELFGEMALLDQTLRSATVRTREESELFVVTLHAMTNLLQQEPQMALWMLKLSSHRLRMLTRMASQMEQAHEVNIKILSGQEEERRRIGRDIHDGVAQSFTDSILRLQFAIQLLDRDPNEARAALVDLENGLRDSLEKIRELIHNLLSKELRTGGLVGAINQFLDRIARYEDLEISFEHRGVKDELPAGLEATLFCIFQEALSNVRKHARATKALIDLRHNGDEVTLTVQDNGCGFDLGILMVDPTEQNTYGLLSMQERTELTGGTMNVDTQDGAGTKLCFVLPVSEG